MDSGRHGLTRTSKLSLYCVKQKQMTTHLTLICYLYTVHLEQAKKVILGPSRSHWLLWSCRRRRRR